MSYYANVPLPAGPVHQYPTPPRNIPVPHNHSPPPLDKLLQQRLTDSSDRLRKLSRSSLNPESDERFWRLVGPLRIYRHLFMHTYVHLAMCCRGSDMNRLEDKAKFWVRWNSIEQLACHSIIRATLLDFGQRFTCHHHHSAFFLQRAPIADDDNDLLCLLLYCDRDPKLYKLPRKPAIPAHGGALKESEQVIELLWKFLMDHKPLESEVARRLRASIYRMARKSAYLPHPLRIHSSSISKEQHFAAGGRGTLTTASMKGGHVLIKRISCVDRTAVRHRIEMFASEAILWKTLQHKNIVPFIGVIEEGVNMGLVSPYFKNGNIRECMKRYNPRDWPALAWKWSGDLAEALKYIHYHEPPVIHGDLKGDNVLVDDADHARLGDFGQSHANASKSSKYLRLDSTRVGIAAYSPYRWMAPELMTKGDNAKATVASDVYSFGCVLYEMVSGELPLDGLSDIELLRRVPRGERPHKPESIGRDDPLWNIVQECWNHDPSGRPSAARLVSLLNRR